MKALVAAVSGIGDILRATPLIRVLSGLGFDVDLLLAPDYLETVTLLEDAPGVGRIYYAPHDEEWLLLTEGARMEGFDQEVYDVAALTNGSLRLRSLIKARKIYEYARSWMLEGDWLVVEKLARAVGWQQPLPSAFAMCSDRDFGLPPKTVALHPGCKPSWAAKRWQGFGELARHFPSVAVVGTEDDLRNGNGPIAWPRHAQIFAGKLSLRETAAVLRQSALMIANDSGLMHLGVAMGTRTAGIFGPTSPQREAMRVPNMFPITKGIACEPECRRIYPYGRKTCEYDIDCMRSLTTAEVLAAVRRIAPDVF
jgi:ADP-heptose:LPS heptosyltransferase